MEQRQVFTEEEASEILQRAISLSGEEPVRSGLTVDELRAIAAEAGLPPHTIDAALRDRFRRSAAIVRAVRGSLDPDDLDVALESVSFATGKHAPKRLGRTLAALVSHRFHSMRLSVSAREGHTLIVVQPCPEVDWFIALAASFGVFFVGTAVNDGVFGLDKPEGLAAFWLLALLAFFVAFGRHRVREGEKSAEVVADQVAATIEESLAKRDPAKS